MAIQMNVAEAKAKLSQLLEAAEQGQEVIIARSGRPIARLTPVSTPPDRELGFLNIAVDDALFAPLCDDDLGRWE